MGFNNWWDKHKARILRDLGEEDQERLRLWLQQAWADGNYTGRQSGLSEMESRLRNSPGNGKEVIIRSW